MKYSLLILGAVLFAACNMGGPSSPIWFESGSYAGTLLLTQWPGTDSA